MRKIPEDKYKVLKYICELSTNIDWILTGSVALYLNNVNINIEKKDIDICLDKNNAYKLDKLLKEYNVKKLEYSQTEKYSSYYAKYIINGVKIDLLGEFKYKLKNGNWSKNKHEFKQKKIIYEDLILKTIILEDEIEEYQEMDRIETVKLIKKIIPKEK